MNVCVAVISSQNTPLFFKTADANDLLPCQFHVYGSLDILEERIRQTQRSSHGDNEVKSNYLGLLYSIGDRYVYGYITNTNEKFILVQQSHSSSAEIPKSNAATHLDDQMKRTFETLHNAYLDLVFSPFYAPNTPIGPAAGGAAKKFENVVDKIIKRSTKSMTSKL